MPASLNASHLPATPFLAVDAAIVETNLAAMAHAAAAKGMDLRPHAKTHKVLELALRQIGLGAVGLTVATLGEAEVFAVAGVTDIFLAFPVWADEGKGARLQALAENVKLTVGIDSVEGARQLAAATAGAPIGVLVEVDSGHHRSGAAAANAGSLARAAADAGLDVRGVFTFPGHGYGPGNQGSAAQDEAQALAAAVQSLAAAGLEAAVVSGGSTPTAAVADAGILTEMRPGVYLFNDAQQVEMGTCGWGDVALWAVATVVSRHGQHIILDSGSKTLGADWPAWTTGGGRLPDHRDARITALSEHHATVEFPENTVLPTPGELIRVVPNHVCAAVNLADELSVMVDGAVADTWRVAARGRNS
ncbi:alanine racemase [Paeniglutamicibacter antarcticus]|uniref:Alanine racemase n=1 Tax=Arthrobacter terrae TaxID=2935737 RepID=A0A931G5E8_9MICC|nr:alanine racemase [Arthrobacter terrae]MBG0740771.1 alanine racemase [Arthrobacter terrae]